MQHDSEQLIHDSQGRISLALGTAVHFSWLRRIIITVFMLNVLDAVLTLIWIWQGKATEGNPFIADLVHNQPGLFVAAKLGLVGLGSALLWRLRHHASAVVAIFSMFLVYYLLLLYHLNSMNLKLIRRFIE